MAARHLRSRKRRRISVRVPSGKSVIVLKKRKKGKERCPCGRDLLGSTKNTKRGFNMLCSVCSREKIIENTNLIKLNQKE